MSRNVRYWSRFSLQNLIVPGVFILFSLVLTLSWSDGVSNDLSLLPSMALMGMLFSFIAFGCGIVVLYLPLLVSMGETRRNVFLGYHYYMVLTIAIGSLLWAALTMAAGSAAAVPAGLPTVISLQIVVAMAGSLIGIVYARYKWVGVAMIALLSGGTAAVFSFVVAVRGEGAAIWSFDFSLPMLPVAAAALSLLEVIVFWLHFRRREVKL